MEPLLPSEIARLVYGYLKKEKNEITAECFLKSSPHLTECYQIFKANRTFNIKVNGFNLHDIFDIFGTMCSMINERISEAYDSKTVIEKLQHLLDENHTSNKVDKCVETESNIVDKCISEVIAADYTSTPTITNIEANKFTDEVLEIPSPDLNSSNISKSRKIETVDDETSLTIEKNLASHSSPHLSSAIQLDKNNSNISNKSETEDKEPIKFQIREQLCSTPSKKCQETKSNVEPTLPFSPRNIQSFVDQPEHVQTPEASSLLSMPGLSKEDRPKDSSDVIDTGELVDTLLNDHSLLEKIAKNINKSIEAQRETDDRQESKILDPPILEKALDSTQSDPEIKNILDEFLVFNVDNADDGKKSLSNDSFDSIKSRLRSAKKKVGIDDAPNKLKKSNLNVTKHLICNNEEPVRPCDNNILMFCSETSVKPVYGSYEILPNHVIMQSSNSNFGHSFNSNTVEIEPEVENYGKSRFVKIAPKITPMYMTQVAEKPIFPKRKKRNLEDFGIKSKFRRTNISSLLPPKSIQPTQLTQSILIEVPNQNSFEIQTNNIVETNNVINLPEISKELSLVKETITHDTPDDRLKPPKNKSMSTPRRRSTHIRCLDFSTPQPKNSARDQARSKLFCDTPKRCEKILEESSSPLPKLQADWGSVNGFESIVKKDTAKHWDTDIRQMVGAGILTSDADGSKKRKKKTPRKKIKPVNEKNNSELLNEEQNTSNNSTEVDESLNDKSDESNISKNNLEINEENFNTSLQDDLKSSKEQSDIPISLETPDKITELCNIQLDQSIESNPLNSFCCTQNDQQQPEITVNKEINHLNQLENSTAINKTSISPKLILPNNNVDKLSNKCSPENLNLPFIELSTNLETEYETVQEITNKNKLKDSNILETPFKILSSITEKNDSKFKQDSDKKFKETYETEKSQELPLIESTKSKSSFNKSSIFETPLKLIETNIKNDSTTDSSISSNPCVQNAENPTKTTVNNVQNQILLSDHNFSNKPIKSKSVKIIDKPTSQDLIESNNSSELKSPITLDSIPPIKHNLIETPYKCDDAAVDVPETPISKLIREYDPSKLVTPLPSTPEHFEDSQSETPLTKIFRETSYLNRPPISPFPPTPGNSRSVDIAIVSPERECFKTFNSLNSKINSLKEISLQPIQATISNEVKSSTVAKNIKVKPTPAKTKLKLSTKSKVNTEKVIAKKKQVYESVKVELFGSEISSSSSADELEKTATSYKKIIINKNPIENERKSGFKPIPLRKSITSSVVVNDTKNNLSNELKSKSILSTFVKPSMEQNNKLSLGSKKTSNKFKKSMVHFDDPVEKIINSSSDLTKLESNDKNSNKSHLQTIINEKSDQSTGLRKLNKSTSFYETNSSEERVKMIKTNTKTSKLNNSDFNINFSNKCNEDNSDTKISKSSVDILSKKTNTYLNNERGNKSLKNSDEIKIFNENKSNQISSQSKVLSDSYKSTCNAETINKSAVSKEAINNISFNKYNQSETSTITNNSSISNTSCITVGHNDESIPQSKIVDDNLLNNIEYLKKTKVYEIITEDGEREMVYLSLSKSFTLLDMPSELNNLQPSNLISSPLSSNKSLDITPKLEAGEYEETDDEILVPVTSTPKDIADRKSHEKSSRSRKSPSFWEDSLHNYPTKHRSDRHIESSRRRNNRDHRYDSKYRSHKSRYDERSQFDNRNHYQKNHHGSIKNDFHHDFLIKDKERFKFKEDRRRSYRDHISYDERKGRDRLEELERFPTTQRMSQNDCHNRAEDIVKKATKRPSDRSDYNKTPSKLSKVEHQRLLKNVDVDDFLSVVHGQK